MRICIIGIGLIGGSLAISLLENGFASEVIGVDKSQTNLDKAIRRRLISSDAGLEEGVRAADVIVLATPVDSMLTLLPRILDLVGGEQTVIDVGSTKKRLLDSVADHPNRRHLVAAHPMAGTEYSGPEAAVPDLFRHKTCVIVDPGASDPGRLATARRLFESMAMHLTELDRDAHDLHCAYVSHISHIASFALALTVLEKERNEDRIFELASSGFGSTVRLAKSSPDMWIPIFRQNRDYVLDVLDEHINQLSRFRSLLIKQDYETFYSLIEEANKIKKIL